MGNRIADLLMLNIDEIIREWVDEMRITDRTEIHKQLLTSELVGSLKSILANIAEAIAARETSTGKPSTSPLLTEPLPRMALGMREGAEARRTRPLGTAPLNSPIIRAGHAIAGHGKNRHTQGYEFHEFMVEFIKLRQIMLRQLLLQAEGEDREELLLALPGIDSIFDELMLVGLESFFNSSVHDLEKKAIHDPLTQIYNKEYFGMRLGEELRRTLRSGDPLTVAMIDMDELKSINDTYGHATGDKAIQTVASAIRDTCRRGDVPCRYGGDEFMVILPETTKAQARIFTERVLRALQSMTLMAAGDGMKIASVVNNGSALERKPLVVPVPTVSVGLASFPEDARNPETLIAKVDAALYRAKRGGRNRIEV